MPPMKYHDNHVFEDDGGAAKNDGRRLRRERRRMGYTLCFFSIFVFILYISFRTDEHRVHINKEMKKQALEMKNEFLRLKKGAGKKLNRRNMEYENASKNVYRWVDRRVIPPIPGKDDLSVIGKPFLKAFEKAKKGIRKNKNDFRIGRDDETEMEWESDADDEVTGNHPGPKVDYTKIEVKHPGLLMSLPERGEYPPLEPLEKLLERWPQDDLDSPPIPFVERLQVFDYSDPVQRQAAVKFRDNELPFKVYNVPEIDAATKKWTDEYVASHFDKNLRLKRDNTPSSKGHCQQSVDSFFAFFRPEHWNVETMGNPPTMDNDWTYQKWAKHARWADRVGLPSNELHYYWQHGVPREERTRMKTKWTFVSRDLPSFSNPEPTFFGFNPSEQKGIQCRFGERGVTAATHYDAGRNMVAMINGAKRYILAPPKECSKLGIVTTKKHPVFRHSLLNFAHINLLNEDSPETKTMPEEEREWLEIAKNSLAIDTILRAGEVLYIPSHWFHYIISLQKSAQCNTRSGRHVEGSAEFGGYQDVVDCVGEDA